jgi:hypothetical protein
MYDEQRPDIVIHLAARWRHRFQPGKPRLPLL